MRAGWFDEWWDRTCALAGPLAKRLASLPAQAAGQIRARARQAVSAYETPDGVELGGVTLIASGVRG